MTTSPQNAYFKTAPHPKSPARALADDWERAARTEPDGIRRSIAEYAAQYAKAVAHERGR